jgi:hypothetical protein
MKVAGKSIPEGQSDSSPVQMPGSGKKRLRPARDAAIVARYEVPGNEKKPLRPARDAAIVARYEVPGNEKKPLRPARDG